MVPTAPSSLKHFHAMPRLPAWLARRDVDDSSAGLPRLTASAAATDPQHAVSLLRESGAVRIDNVLSKQTCKALHAHSIDSLATALAEVKAHRTAASDVFAEHLLIGEQANKRHDVKLSLKSPTVQHAVREVLQSLHAIFVQSLGADAELFELSSITSEVGTPAQTPHADFAAWPDDEDCPGQMVVVCFIALTDLKPRMGPTHFRPGSHTRAFHSDGAAASSASCEDLSTSAYCAPLLKAGDAVLMDSACFHAGGANTLRSRTVFHVSFARGGFKPRGFDRFAQSLEGESGVGEGGGGRVRRRLDEAESWLGEG